MYCLLGIWNAFFFLAWCTWQMLKNLQGELKKDNDNDNSKKKLPKEHAHKYQLDVLEQAKNKNTISFLETGAGKTLIVVLLIKSVCNDLHRQGKKMLAVFLVPKVPLVYQVGWYHKVFCLLTYLPLLWNMNMKILWYEFTCATSISYPWSDWLSSRSLLWWDGSRFLGC